MELAGLFAGCAICAANSNPWGWFVLAGATVGFSALVVAMMVWYDRHRQG